MKQNEIVLIHGTDYADMTVRLLEKIDLSAIIGSKTARVAVKPNLVIADKADRGAVTHPEIVDGVLRYRASAGFENVRVIEGSWVGDRTSVAFEESGIAAVCRKRGVKFYDLQKDSFIEKDARGMTLKLCKQAAETDFLINLPVVKGHCQTTMTCALKNAKGLIPNSEKRRFHTMGLHKPIAHLNTILPRQLIVADNICGDLNFEEGGNPVTMNRIFACMDPVLCDAFAAECMGYSVDDVPYIRMAERLGVGSADTEKAEIVRLNEPKEQRTMQPTGRVRSLSRYAAPKQACSACYGSLIYALDRLDEAGQTYGRKEKICIGQGYKGESGGIGVGICTKGCKCSLAGCPPKASDMVEFLKENWK